MQLLRNRYAKLTILIIVFLSMSFSVNAKNKGELSNYQQITDKEILIESTKGVIVLFTAFDNNNIGVTCFGENENVQLKSGSQLLIENNLNGSIYVEQINELIQISTASDDGLLIVIDSKNFKYTFIDKATNEKIVLEEGQYKGLSKKEFQYFFVVNKQVDINLATI